MSKFLSLCNKIVSVGSTSSLESSSGGEKSDKYMEACGMLWRAKLTNDELKYGMAVVGNGTDFEVIVAKQAKRMIADAVTLSDNKLAERSACMAELVMGYIRGENKKKTDDDKAAIVRVKARNWRERYSTIYEGLQEWCNALESDANVKVWKVIDNEK